MTVEACRLASCVGVGYEIGSRSVTGAAKNLSQAQLQALVQVVARWVNNRCSCTTDDLTESESAGCVSIVGVNAAHAGRSSVPPLPPLLRSQSPRKPRRP